MFVLWATLAFLGCVVLLVGVLVATPMHLRLSAEAGAQFRVRAEVRTLWGLSPGLKIETGSGGGDTPGPHRQSRRRREDRKREKAARGIMDADKLFQLLHAVPEALLTAVRRIHIDRLRLRTAFGFEDPADTGRAFGMLTPVIYGLPCDCAEVIVEPDFDGRRFEGSADVSLHLTPLAVAWPVLRLVLLFRRMRS